MQHLATYGQQAVDGLVQLTYQVKRGHPFYPLRILGQVRED